MSIKTKLVIFGITGDLGKRKLLPALKHIFAAGHCEEVEVIGVSRNEVNVKELLVKALGSDELADKISIFTMDLSARSDYHKLADRIALQPDEQVLFYLSVPPNASEQIISYLGDAGLNTKNFKIMVEKPFGFDLASARQTIENIGRYFDESQVLRVDHYLAKEMAQNIVVLRGANPLFRHVWSHGYIESIDIVASEVIGIEGRVQFYEQTGAIRDILQGHLMQLAALTLMHVPEQFDWAKVADKRLDAFRSIQPAEPTRATIAQYNGYRDEVDNLDSRTETFVSVELLSNDDRWRGVPIRLTTGKALSEKTTEIIITFKAYKEAVPSRLIIRIQPNEGVSVDVTVKKPGYDFELMTQTLTFSFETSVDRMPEAYEQVFVDAIRGERSLFATSDEVVRAWEIVAPIQQALTDGTLSIGTYQKGSEYRAIIAAE